jgi:hypothetical protein
MSGTPQEPKKDIGAPRWIPAYAALNTILLAFFICLSVNMGKHQELGYMGPGLGAFREAFTSQGFPSVLSGARKMINMFTWGGKYVPEGDAEGEEKPWFETRLTEPPDRDMMQLQTDAKHANTEVRFPLPISNSPRFDGAEAERLAAAGRLVRLSGRPILVCATIPPGKSSPEEAWRAATTWAMRVARHLNEKESVPAGRITAVGRVADVSPGSVASAEPAMMLVMLPKEKDLGEQFHMIRQPETEYQMLRQGR